MGDVWFRLARALSRVGERGADVSLAVSFARSRMPASTRALARFFVEGYHAAHTDRVSARALATDAEDMREPQRQFRLADGYSGIVEWLRAGLDPELAIVLTGCVLEAIRWRLGSGEEMRRPLRHLFLFIGAEPNTAWLSQYDVALDAKGFVRTGADLAGDRRPFETSHAGVFAIAGVALYTREGFSLVGATVGAGILLVANVGCTALMK